MTQTHITWTQHHVDGTTTDRGGLVWSKAPILPKRRSSWNADPMWVSPDEPLPTDPYTVVVVATNHQGQRFSDDSEMSATGSLGHGADRAARQTRRQG